MRALTIIPFLCIMVGSRLFGAIVWTDRNSDGYLDLVTDDGSGQFEIEITEYTLGFDDYADVSWDTIADNGFNYKVEGHDAGLGWGDFTGIINASGGYLIDCLFELLVQDLPTAYRLVKFGKASAVIGSPIAGNYLGTGGDEELQKVEAAVTGNSGGIFTVELAHDTPPLTGGAVAVIYPKGQTPAIANIKVLGVELGVTASGTLVVSFPSSLVGGALENYEFAIVFSEEPPIKIDEVWFEKDGLNDNYHQLISDDAQTTYAKPHWFDENGDGDAADQNDKNYPVAFTRNTKPEIGAVFKVGSGLNNQDVKIKATGPGNIAIPETTVTVSQGEADLDATRSSGAFVNTIKFHSAQESGKEFKLTWEMKVADNDWIEVGETKHTLYLTLAAPKTSLRQETLFNLSTRRADGKNDSSKATVDSIYAEFTDQKVYKVDPGTGLQETQKMTYHKFGASCTTTAGLLSVVNRDGSCTAWSSFFRDVLRAIGISADQIEVRLDPDTDVINVETLTSGLLNTEHRFAIKAWTFNGSGTSGDPDYPYTTVGVGADAVPGTRIKAQGNDNSPEMFNAHWIVKAANTFYDPSYGSDAVSNTVAGKSAYENNSFDGYFNYKLIPVGNGYEVGDRIAKKNDTGLREVNMYTDN